MECTRVKLEQSQIDSMTLPSGDLLIPKSQIKFAYKYFAPMKDYHNQISWLADSLTGFSYFKVGMIAKIIDKENGKTAHSIYVDQITENDNHWIIKYIVI